MINVSQHFGKGIKTAIAKARIAKEVYQEFVSLGVSVQPLPQGDTTIRISPFDDYFLFTLYQDPSSGNLKEPIPIDLTSVGTLYISFIGENDEIRIPYHTQVAEVNMSSGQVLFRISKEESKKILALDNDNFYISSVKIDEKGNAVSDESVLYTGKFLTLTDEAQKSMTEKYEALLELSIKKETDSQFEILNLTNELAAAQQTIGDRNDTITALNNSNIELVNELTELTKETTSATILAAQQAAQAAQQSANATDASNAIAFGGLSNQCKVQALQLNIL